MSYANIHEIKRLIHDKSFSLAEISMGAGVHQTALGKYRRGESSVENMSLLNAIKLQKYYEKLREDNKLQDIMSREEVFGRALGAIDVISAKHFEKGKPSIATNVLPNYNNKPMTLYYQSFKDITKYAHLFDDIDQALINRAIKYIGTMNPSDYSDEPIEPTYLIFVSKEITEVEILIKNKKLIQEE